MYHSLAGLALASSRRISVRMEPVEARAIWRDTNVTRYLYQLTTEIDREVGVIMNSSLFANIARYIINSRIIRINRRRNYSGDNIGRRMNIICINKIAEATQDQYYCCDDTYDCIHLSASSSPLLLLTASLILLTSLVLYCLARHSCRSILLLIVLFVR